jgi:broad specificity phosphatase PhoE
LSFSEYFFSDAIEEIDENYLKEIGLLDYVKKVEKYKDIIKRSKKVLDRLLKSVGDDKLVIIVTHQAFTDEIVKQRWQYKD